MRICWGTVAALLILVPAVEGQEPGRAPASVPVPSQPPGAAAPAAVPRQRPASRRVERAWWPVSRWLGQDMPGEGPGPDMAGGAGAPVQPGNPGQPGMAASLFGPPAANAGGAAGGPGAAGGGQGDPNAPPGGGERGTLPISGNPAAVNIVAGTGALGRLLGLEDDDGIRFGGLWIGDASGVLSGGRSPGKWGLNSLAVADLNFDAEKLFGWEGGMLGTQFLQFTGERTNDLAGAFPGFDSLEVVPPLTRQELYQLWWRQSFFDDKLIVRIGKTVPTFDFNNVVRPVPVSDPAAGIPAVSGLIYTPIFVNPTMLGVIPGYYNSATGITTTVAPTENFYLNYGFYDGNLANHRQTGLEGPHFNGYYFHIGEVGYSYRLGPERKPGNFGVGVWGQTGKLDSFAGGTVNGANGVYLFGAQRLWFRHPSVDNSGVSGFYQFGANSNDALRARQYFGAGLTAFGLVPGRPDDTFGAGLAWTWLTDGAHGADAFFPNVKGPVALAPSQLMLAVYYQMKVVDGVFFQTTLTDIPNPGQSTVIPNALALTFRIVVLF